MDPTQNGHSNPSGLNVAPPRADNDHPSPQIPGKARLDEALGKVIGGTVISSDIDPSNLPTTEKLEAEKTAQNPPAPVAVAPTSQPMTPVPGQDEKLPVKENGTHTPPPVHGANEKEVAAQGVPVEHPKHPTVGAYPEVTRLGWMEAYKRVDGPNNEFREKSIWMEEFASSALFGAFWQNAVVVIVVPIVCFIVFKLGGGFISLIMIIAFGGKDGPYFAIQGSCLLLLPWH
jgi:hypothetical protein